ncbi:DNA/RNA non-specific endonuclease [Hymenobacter weizhouensis]|uniref:DNA/RNA non-specific endonuclease n=1 Tax=Hymenobacter sp. YIM 151500-1 TaxID=2987689 RepID=UPI0022273535|nr:DNA/RNA non-specific endonuclease [Hymenobacter sp. YIM 151500-1]UYZ64413.1 DNA/RNA non-specific endonuclease [Hymenobacter sp. YIM 151500-1]
MLRPASLLLLGITLACSQPDTASSAAAPPAEAPANQAAPRLTETFETGSKSAYTPAEEALGTGRWLLDDALLGSSDQDHKRGRQAARLRGRGRLRMAFDAPAGVRLIRISSAAYGQDPASTWELWASQDGGRSYRRLGQPVRTQGPRLVVSAFLAPTPAPLRLEIRKTDGSPARLNLDDIELATTPDPAAGAPAAPAAASPTGSGSPPSAAPSSGQATRTLSPQDLKSLSDHLLLGNPSGATASLSSPTNYLLSKPQYAVGYNAQRGTPTWVSWHLSPAWMGSAPRQDDFRPDPALPRQFYAVTPRSYSGSGFDKGHSCPSGDRTFDLDDNSNTFLMTNMIPQAGNNNQRTWSALEEWTRQQVRQGQEAYIIMGCYGKGGTGANGYATTLDQGRVTVPARIWKVVVLLPEGPDDLRRIAAGQARILAVDTPNDQSVSPDWSRYRVSVAIIEQATGLDLLSQLPPEVQTRLQKKVDTGPVR